MVQETGWSKRVYHAVTVTGSHVIWRKNEFKYSYQKCYVFIKDRGLKCSGKYCLAEG